MWKKWTDKLSRHPDRDPWSAGNNKECERNGLTTCQGTQAEIHGQLGTTKNVEEMDLQTVKAPRQRSRVSWEQQRMWKKWTYILSRHPGRDPWSAGNNKECGRNGLTRCQGTHAEIHGQLGTTKNVEEIDLLPVRAPRQSHSQLGTAKNVEEMDLPTVKAPRQRSRVSWEQQRIWKKWTYFLSRHPGRDPW